MDRPDKRGANVVSTHTAAYPRQPVGFNTQPPEGGCLACSSSQVTLSVSTHSRPKAAAAQFVLNLVLLLFQHTAARRRLRRQCRWCCRILWFQHTAARRRLQSGEVWLSNGKNVSTHSRPKAAADGYYNFPYQSGVSTHSRPKAAALWAVFYWS